MSFPVTFIGGGNMAGALIGGLIRRGFAAGDMHVVEPNAARREQLVAEFGASVHAAAAPEALTGRVILAIKPQQMREVAQLLAPHAAGRLFVSIAAGIRAADLSRWLGGEAHVARSMPNTPALVGAGVTALFAAPGVSEVERADAQTLLGAVGATLWVADEALLDAVTALSGSGPAYVFYFLEALAEAGAALGLPERDARMLALATVAGAARLAQDGEDPALLRARVTSKGGTTERALSIMQAEGFKPLIARALAGAAERSRELGDQLGLDAPPT
jgi:pyrroline-5-carboxylate reductase